MWLSRWQMRSLVVLLALLPLVPTIMLVQLMIEKAERQRADAVEAEMGVLRDQTIHLIERSAQSQRLTADARMRADEKARANLLFDHLHHIFGEEVILSIFQPDGKQMRHHGIEPSDDAIVMEVQGGHYSGWWVAVDGLLPIPDEYDGQVRAVWLRAIGIVLGVVVVAAVVWFTVHRGLRVGELRSDLLTTISHEMKTPLASMRVLLETLTDEESPVIRTEEQRNDYIDLVAKENRRLSKLTEDFLTFARLERGDVQLKSEPVRLRKVVEEVIEELAPGIAQTGAEISVELDARATVVGDGDALAGVVRNLVENALKYAGGADGTSPRIAIDADTDCRGRWLLRVSDQGRGIPASLRKVVFRRYYRADSELSDGGSGVGLGLAICRQFVRRMKGKIWIEEPAEGGCRFVIRLKAASMNSAADPLAEASRFSAEPEPVSTS